MYRAVISIVIYASAITDCGLSWFLPRFLWPAFLRRHRFYDVAGVLLVRRSTLRGPIQGTTRAAIDVLFFLSASGPNRMNNNIPLHSLCPTLRYMTAGDRFLLHFYVNTEYSNLSNGYRNSHIPLIVRICSCSC